MKLEDLSDNRTSDGVDDDTNEDEKYPFLKGIHVCKEGCSFDLTVGNDKTCVLRWDEIIDKGLNVLSSALGCCADAHTTEFYVKDV